MELETAEIVAGEAGFQKSAGGAGAEGVDENRGGVFFSGELAAR